jgi:hypothetical protein|tara:strand:- start:948 stop:1142 length:195 start_codon:yes stop_codon:yes gene_type:complete
MQKKTIIGNHERLMDRARSLLQEMDEKDAMYALQDDGCSPEISFLVVKAAKILAEPYLLSEEID